MKDKVSFFIFHSSLFILHSPFFILHFSFFNHEAISYSYNVSGTLLQLQAQLKDTFPEMNPNFSRRNLDLGLSLPKVGCEFRTIPSEFNSGIKEVTSPNLRLGAA